MKVFNIVNIDFGKDRIKEFCINNFNAISSSIKQIIQQVRANTTSIDSNIDKINNSTLQVWTTTDRPTNTKNSVVIGINSTTRNINYTTDNGATWFNYDGTTA